MKLGGVNMNKRLKALTCSLIFSLSLIQSKVYAVNYLSEGSPRIDINKEWVVKFNSPLKMETVNNKNILVTDDSGKTIPVNVSIGASSDIVLVSPIVSGYDPNKKYNLVISPDVKSISGKSLGKTINMQFNTINKYSDGTSYEGVPQIASLSFDYNSLLSNQKPVFFINSKSGTDAQYRIFVHNYADSKDVYTELTDGYVSAEGGKITSSKILTGSSSGEKYKVVVYSKRANTAGAHKDINTDYDNYYVDYFRVVDSTNIGDSQVSNYGITLDEMINIQKNVESKPVFVEYSDMSNEASKNHIKYYVNPSNFLDNYGKYQFLKLTYSEGITAEDLDNILKGKGILEGKGQVFLDAAKEANINPAYLVSHALLETGNGKSQLANGGINDSSGNPYYGVPVYNFFGIGAFDVEPNLNGTRTAYENKWFSPEEAIMGGAKWISPRYINNPNGKQDTLYKMRWNPEKPGTHQYATDVSWAYKQIPRMYNIMSQVKNPVLSFEIPKYK